ncbi:hypothetical protein GMDG_03270 [Pseudogymnoascus destructans 20631-21]|uniref:Uncharacterized protein n=1 Tax=Pseudogymnoascus destructans (strain ATCC MYA-4855 / 20631-21) TaxID=658429 RepID=L8G5Q0_PSED2|nr:hypothetical protein GMDG_03270 [Pseudogymnoascus destructans 20631-21]
MISCAIVATVISTFADSHSINSIVDESDPFVYLAYLISNRDAGEERKGAAAKLIAFVKEQDLEIVHGKLVAQDPSFGSIPIDETDNSHDLRTAHAQRIISNAICEYVWKPLRSEFTLLHPDFNSLLVKLSDELLKYNPDGRVAKVWTALTMRA